MLRLPGFIACWERCPAFNNRKQACAIFQFHREYIHYIFTDISFLLFSSTPLPSPPCRCVTVPPFLEAQAPTPLGDMKGSVGN